MKSLATPALGRYIEVKPKNFTGWLGAVVTALRKTIRTSNLDLTDYDHSCDHNLTGQQLLPTFTYTTCTSTSPDLGGIGTYTYYMNKRSYADNSQRGYIIANFIGTMFS